MVLAVAVVEAAVVLKKAIAVELARDRSGSAAVRQEDTNKLGSHTCVHAFVAAITVRSSKEQQQCL